MANVFGQNVTFVPFHHVLQFPEAGCNIKTGVDNVGPSVVVKGTSEIIKLNIYW